MVQAPLPKSKPRMTETSTLTHVHVAYSPIAFMNHQLTISLHDGYSPLHVQLPEKYNPPSLPTLCNLLSTMFHFSDDYPYPTKGTLHDLPSLASPEGEMGSSFSWTILFKSPTSSTLCFGDPTLAKLNQVKLLCETEFVSPSTFFFVTLLFILELHFCSHPRPYHTSQRCTSILQPQVKYNQERLKKPHLPILPRSKVTIPWN